MQGGVDAGLMATLQILMPTKADRSPERYFLAGALSGEKGRRMYIPTS